MDGLLLINKPKGFTSHDVVNVVRKKLNIKKVGHTGTLDPNATGVLQILVGTATKISKYLVEHKKTYIATITLGKKTDTGDLDGNIIGKQNQIPPMYSAIKVNGKKLYEYAREGKKVDIKPREIEIYDIKLKKYQNSEITFEVECSKGTYIRTLCEDIARKLGTIGCMKDLKRTKVDTFSIENAVSLENLDYINIEEKIIPIEKIFLDKLQINLNERKLELFLNGVQLTYELKDGVYRIYNNNKFIGLGIIKNKLLKRDVVI